MSISKQIKNNRKQIQISAFNDMRTNISKMQIMAVLFPSLLMTLCLCLYIDGHQTIFYNDEQEIKVTPADVDVTVNVDTSEPLHHIEEYFISYNIDSQEFSEHFEKMNFRLLYFSSFFVFCMLLYMIIHKFDRGFLWAMVSRHFGPRTLRTQDISALRKILRHCAGFLRNAHLFSFLLLPT